MRLLTLTLSLVLLFSVSAQANDSRVVVTIKPIHSLVAGVMGNTGQPAVLVEGLSSPHGYALKPSQRKLLQEANLVFLIDPYFESFLAKVLHDLPGHVRVINLVRAGGVTVLNHRKGGAWDPHVHSAHTHKEKEEHEDHSHEEGHADHDLHDESNNDLHIWLDPRNAIALTKAIAKELVKVYPENRRIYNDNTKAQIARLEALDTELADILASVKGKPFIVYHDAYQYLERRYGLTAAGSLTLEPEQKVSAKRLQEIRARLKDANVVCVFREPQFDDKLVRTVIEGTKVKSGTLDPIGADIQAGTGLYEILLRGAAKELVECLRE